MQFPTSCAIKSLSIGHCLIAQNILIMRALLYFQIIFILLKINGMLIRLV